MPILRETKPSMMVELPLPISIPATYVPDQNMRIQLYRRLADVQSKNQIEKLKEEFVDRFGPLVPEVQNLFFQLKIRLLAEKAGLASVSVESGQIVLRYPTLAEGEPERQLPSLDGLARSGRNAYWMPFDKMKDDWQHRLEETLMQIIKLARNDEKDDE